MDENLASMSQLATELGINKSKLNYYMNMGVITPLTVVGRICIFDRALTLSKLKEINKAKKNGRTLTQIKRGLR